MKQWHIALITTVVLIAGALWAWSLYLQSLPGPAPVHTGEPTVEVEPAGPEIPDYPFEDEPIEPKFEEAIDLRGDDPAPTANPSLGVSSVFSSQGKPNRPIPVNSQTRENCEGWVQIAFENKQGLVNGQLDILDSKPPGKHDAEATELLFEVVSLQEFSGFNYRMETTYFKDGRQENTFTYFVGCDLTP